MYMEFLLKLDLFNYIHRNIKLRDHFTQKKLIIELQIVELLTGHTIKMLTISSMIRLRIKKNF